MPRRGARGGIGVVALLGLLLVVGAPTPAFAYIDPGVGSMIWQVAMAGALTLAYFGRRLVRWVAHLFRGGPRPTKSDADERRPTL